jgi:DNA-binding winged helix-turn-helix (wHTH) protein/TolB-like protein/Tfp pilus assembly protein PilF
VTAGVAAGKDLKELFSFGPYVLDTTERSLSRGGQGVSLTPKAFDALVLLVHNAGHLLEKDDLMKQLWPETAVEEGNLSQCIYTLRKTLSGGSDGNGTGYIQTVPRRGYRFVGSIERISMDEAASHPEPPAPADTPGKAKPTPNNRPNLGWKFVAAAAAAVLLAFAAGAWWLIKERSRDQRSGGPAPASIAVLPFLNLTGSLGNDYLSDGFTEELTTELAEFHGLRVVARTSAFQFRGKGEDVRKIGSQLGVKAVIEGSIGESGHVLHVTARLISTQNGYHLWSGAYDGERSTLYSIEEQIVRQTAQALGVPAIGQEQTSSNRRTEDPEAHDLYLEGRYFWYKRDLPDMEKSIRYFRAALKKDPNYALAYLGLAETYVVMAGNGQKPYGEVMPLARVAVNHALALDPGLAEAHVTLAMLLPPWGDLQTKRSQFRRAVELSPGYATAHEWYGVILTGMGRFREADAELREAQILDPLSPVVTDALAENFYYWRRYDNVIEQVRRIRQMGSSLGDPILGLAYIQKRMYKDAIIVFRGLPKEDDAATRLTYLACAYAASGQSDEARKLLNQTANPANGYVAPVLMARAFALLGDQQTAISWLEKAYKQSDPTLGVSIKGSPIFDPLRSDPRFPELLRRMGFTH